MRYRTTIPWVATLLAILLAIPILAQPGRGRGEPRYDLETEIELTGTVTEVIEVDGPGNRQGIHLMLKVDETHREICIGPMSYLESEEIAFSVGETMEVVGSEFDKGDGLAVLVREIVRGDETITLRDARGAPRWSRGNN